MKFLLSLALPLLTWAGPCSPNPCNNEGACQLNGKSYTCHCLEDFVGVQCEFPNPCVSESCSGHGDCQVRMAEYNPIKAKEPKAHCECKVGWGGDFCEIEVGCGASASDDPCGANGRCTTDALEHYACQCEHGYQGDRCEQIDYCASSPCAKDEICTSGASSAVCRANNFCDLAPCKNGGRCSVNGESYNCMCAPGWSGDNCEIAESEPCDSTKCINGSCKKRADGKSVCECNVGFEGPHCTENVDDCANHQCYNGGICQDMTGGYACHCTAGWTGKHCTLDVDECATTMGSRCKNGATCQNTVGSYNCLCINGFSGTNCEINDDDCRVNDCAEGSICVDELGKYTCKCPPGKSGARCDLTNECYDYGPGYINPCGNGFCDPNENGFAVCTCFNGWEGETCEKDIDECLDPDTCGPFGTCINRPGSWECKCKRGYTGKRCDKPVDLCEKEKPCFNGGTCIKDANFEIGYYCSCPPSHEGDNCMRRKMHCEKNSCLNGGTCRERYDGFVCSCEKGYEGNNCERRTDYCAQADYPCSNGKCHNEHDDYRCVCSEGWTGRNCTENVNECAPNPCKNGKCTDYVNDFSCECDEGWEGRLCEKPINPCLSEPCYNGECKVPAPGKFECICPKGTGGKYCKDNVNECQGITCEHGGLAKDSVGKCICECKPGFEGQFCQVNIDDCEPNPCLNKGECVDLVNEYKCRCPKGTWGDRCYSNKNACSPSPCYNYGTCVETGVGQFQCKCTAGFGGVNCEIDLCADNGFCQNNGVSVPIGNHFTAGTDTCRCKCPPNFEGKQCEISTVCKARNPCKHGTCRSQDGDNVECVCDAGYSGKYCDTKLDECTNGSVCHNGGICMHDYDNKAICHCPPGWTGRFCDIDRDECKENKNICKNNGICENTEGGYYCKCDGFKGKHCENDIDDCAHSPCKNGGSCINNTSGRGFTCDCKSGFSGVRCQDEINECDGNPCLNGGNCTDMVDSYQCTCPSGYRGVRCEIQRISICAENPCANNGVCKEVVQEGEFKFQCKCPDGFSGEFCETNIDDCKPNSCLNKGICKDKVNGFECKCNPAFYGERCEHLNKLCQKEPGLCQNGGTCIDDGSQDAGYRCVCPKSHGGLHCDVPLDTCEAAAVALKISESQVCKNSGKCQNERHGHSCACKQGFEGDHCETEVDLCKNHVCHNGGDCFVQEDSNSKFVPYSTCRCPKAYAGSHCEKFIGDALCNKPDACQNGGTCVVDNYNFEKGYFCICPFGISGDNCEINEDDCIKPTSDGEEPCMGHGKCTDGVVPINGQYGYFNCNCMPGYEGSRCEATTNYCHQNTCNDVGTANCRPILNGFICECKHGYEGYQCEKYKPPKTSPCDEEDPCMNGSTCSLALYTNTGFKCHCVKDGTYGERCEEKTLKCGALHCYNSDTCALAPTGEETCECRVGYTGPTCAIEASEQKCWMKDSDKCQPKCNVKECNYCDGKCALGQKDPWDSCDVAKCRNLFNNGRCDEDCNNENCMFDGRDCEVETSRDGCAFESYCATIYGNGECDQGCNNAACGWDGLDCLDGKPKDIASGSITVYIDMEEDNVPEDQFWKLVERNISISMKSNVFIVSTEKIDPYETEAENRGESLTRHRRVAEPGTSRVVMQIDNRGCTAVSFNCYHEAGNFARDMSAQRVTGGLAYPGFVMHDIGSTSTPYRQPWNNMPMMATIGSLLLVTVLVGALVNRKRKRGTLWEGLGPIPTPPSKRTKNGQGQLGYYDKGKQHDKNSFMYGQSPPYMGGGNIYNPKGNNVDWSQHGFPITSEEAPMLGYAEPNSILAQKGPDRRDILHIMSIQADHTYTDEEMQNLLKSGICPNNQTERYEETPLHLAARSGNASFAQQLLRNGADPGIKDKNGRTPLHVAISSDSKGVFYVLIQNPHLRVNFDEKDESGHTPLITAAKLAIEWGIQELIQQNVDVNVVDNNGKSALHWAAEVNNSAACEQLLKHGANKDLQTEREETPLFLAAREGARECVEVLLAHMAAKDTADIAGRKPEDIAAQRGHDDVVRLLKSAVNSHLYDYNSCQKNASFFNSQKKSIPNKKRSRPDSKSSKNAKRSKPQGGARPTHPYARSISNIPSAYGSSPLTPPNDRNFPYQTLHSQSRLQQSQGLHGSPFPPAHLTHYMEMNQTMPCTPHSAYKNYDAWTTQVHMAQYTSFHAAAAHPTLYSRSFQSPPMNQVQQTSLMADTAVQGSPDYNSPSADNLSCL